MRASPVGQGPSFEHARASSGPAARWMAPHTPPPGASCSLAALTIPSTASVVISTIRAESGTAKSDGRKGEARALDFDRHPGPDDTALQHPPEPTSAHSQGAEKGGPLFQANVWQRVEYRTGIAGLADLEQDFP